jgi:K+-sensing histidine kinase KdpD
MRRDDGPGRSDLCARRAGKARASPDPPVRPLRVARSVLRLPPTHRPGSVRSEPRDEAPPGGRHREATLTDPVGSGPGPEPDRRRHARFADVIARATATLAASPDAERHLADAAGLLVPACADWCTVDLLDADGTARRIARVGTAPDAPPAGLPPAAGPDRSRLAVPLLIDDAVIGAIALGRHDPPWRFRPSDRVLVEVLARQAALALDRARLRRETSTLADRAERVVGQLRRLHALSAALTAALTPDEVARVVVDLGIDAFGAAASVLVVPREDESVLEIVRVVGYTDEMTRPWRRMPLDAPAPLAEAARTGELVWVESPEARQTRFPSLGPTSGLHAAWAAVPMVTEGRVVGVLGLSFQHARTHDEGEWELLRAAAQHAALALERAQLYEATQQAHAAARDALRARDDFISLAAHELRTPITSLRAFASLLDRRLREDRSVDLPAIRLGIAAIDRQSARLTTLVAQLLDVARLEGGQLAMTRAQVNLADLTREIVEQHRVIVPAHALVIDAPEPVVALVDALHLEQVLANLLGNAAKFSPVGSTIEAEVRSEGDRWATIAVRDHGPGVPLAMADRAFGRYVRQGGAENPTGLGLGLFISREIARLHGGDLTLESPEDGGARFVVRLPLAPDA